MKIAIVSAAFGVEPFKFVPQRVPVDVFAYHPNNVEGLFRFDMDGRLASKVFKTLMHQIVPGYDLYIWLDASAEIEPQFVEWVIETIGENDVLVMRHPHRQSIQDEAQFVVAQMTDGMLGMQSRYATQPVLAEVAHYLKNGHQDHVLYANGMFACVNTPAVNAAMEEWWGLIARWSNLCQISMPYVLQKHHLKTVGVAHAVRYDLAYGDESGAAYVGPHHKV
ncbi:hypothetical protein D4R30_00910 [archaeon]|nr:MAG: hypothetical protein D4R30_00910 [archaeon]